MAHIVFKVMMGTQNASSLHFRDRSEVAQTRPVGHFRLPICLCVAHESPPNGFYILNKSCVYAYVCIVCTYCVCACPCVYGWRLGEAEWPILSLSDSLP